MKLELKKSIYQSHFKDLIWRVDNLFDSSLLI